MQEIRTLDNVTFDEIAKAFNIAFSDYFFKVELTKKHFEEKFKNEGGRLDLSVGVFENNKLIAFILHFINETNNSIWNYNGGTGVVPESRGNRLTSKMYDFILPKLVEKKVDKMILEVLSQNTPAIKVYERQGFEITRELILYKGKLEIKKPNLNGNYKVEELKDLNWDKLVTFWDHPPTWQNSIATMNNLQKQNLSLGIMEDDTILGYIIYNPKFRRIHQMAVDRNYRNHGLGSQLLNAISSIEKGDISFINIDSKIPYFDPFLKNRGLKRFGSQYEMELVLN